ncbi:MAG TPA: galactose-1-epimerase, partial [Polyangiaceae bacterium]
MAFMAFGAVPTRLFVAFSLLSTLSCTCPQAELTPPAEAPVTSALPPAAAPPPAAVAPAVVPAPAPKATIAKAPFGQADGKDVTLFTLINEKGLVLKAINYGAAITELHVPDRTGKLADVVLGFETLEGYTNGKNPFFGVTVGRVANRIRGAKFKLGGKEYQLGANDGPHHLHGGPKGWDKVVWDTEAIETPDGPSLRFRYVSKDGEEGYPGTVTAQTTYTLTNQNELRVEMMATTD